MISFVLLSSSPLAVVQQAHEPFIWLASIHPTLCPYFQDREIPPPQQNKTLNWVLRVTHHQLTFLVHPRSICFAERG